MLCEMNNRLFFNLLNLASCVVCCGGSMALAAEPQTASPVYQNNFEQAAVGTLPEDLFLLDGGFAVREEGGNRFLELPGAPLDSFGLLFGPTEKQNLSVSARALGTGKGRRYPAFGVGLNGGGGYKLMVAPAKKAIELHRGDSIKATAPFEWQSGKWTHFRLELRGTSGGVVKVVGKVWQEGNPEPAAPSIEFEDAQEPPPGRASIWGSPFAGTPIRYDDLSVSRLK